MNVEEEIFKLYEFLKINEKQIIDLTLTTKQQIEQLTENISLMIEKTQQTGSIVADQLAPQVQILREEVLSLKKRFPDK